MTDQDQIETVKISLEEANEQIALKKAIITLQNNSDFKKVINEAYMKQEAVRLVHMKGQPHVGDKASQDAITRNIDGIGSLVTFLNRLYQEGTMAEKAKLDHEETLMSLEA